MRSWKEKASDLTIGASGTWLQIFISISAVIIFRTWLELFFSPGHETLLFSGVYRDLVVYVHIYMAWICVFMTFDLFIVTLFFACHESG